MSGQNENHEIRENFNIPFLKIMVAQISEFVNMKKRQNAEPFENEMALIETYPDFYNEYPFIIKKIVKGDDLAMLDVFFKQLEQVQGGKKSLESVEYNLGQDLAKKYIPNYSTKN